MPVHMAMATRQSRSQRTLAGSWKPEVSDSQQSAEERADDHVRVQLAKMRVLLPSAHEHHGLPCFVRHRQRRTNFVVDGIELGEHNAVDFVLLVEGR